MINGFFLFQFKSLFSLGKFLISLKFDFRKSTSWKSEIKLKIQLSSLNHVTAKKNNNNLKRNQKRNKDILNIHYQGYLQRAEHFLSNDLTTLFTLIYRQGAISLVLTLFSQVALIQSKIYATTKGKLAGRYQFDAHPNQNRVKLQIG